MIEKLSLRVSPKVAADIAALKQMVAKEIGMPVEDINDIKIIRRSIDARQQNIKINLNLGVAYGEHQEVKPDFNQISYPILSPEAPQLIIVGAGPAGLFAALKAIELGIRPILLERGKDVDQRRVDVAQISKSGKIDDDSNYCFGEGGAGAFSDGKLFTRSKKRGNIERILQILHQHGASEEILIDSHPHIGSDRLPKVIKNIRNTILNSGGIIRFQTKVVDFIIEDCNLIGVKTSDGETIKGAVVLATGHSARDIYHSLHRNGVELENKSLAMGVRLEHPQNLIDRLQYHNKEGRGKYLPAAEYNFVTQIDGRGVYSFCMCPGGVVVPAMSGPQQSVVNGMSASARNSQWANSGMVVEIHPDDIEGYSDQPMGLLRFQEDLERKFYEASEKSIKAPAQRMTDFVGRKSSTGELPRTSYSGGIFQARLDKLLPPHISNRLIEGFKIFDRRCKGFLTNEALLIGLESRTSSPIRIPRNPDTLEHVIITNLYPAGEGAGYAGGIVSAAVDGERCVEAYHSKLINSKMK